MSQIGNASITSDALVLESIFNPENPLSTLVENSDILPDENNAPPENVDPGLIEEIRGLEAEAVRTAESGNLTGALSILDRAVTRLPTDASLFNNRAQAHRLLGDNAAALADLDQTIRLSGGKGKAARQAFTQRGLLHKLSGKNEEALDDFKAAAKLGSSFAQAQVFALVAIVLVHVIFAILQAVKMNPYAALCNQMLSEAVAKLRSGQT